MRRYIDIVEGEDEPTLVKTYDNAEAMMADKENPLYQKTHPLWVTCFKHEDGRISLFVFKDAEKHKFRTDL